MAKKDTGPRATLTDLAGNMAKCAAVMAAAATTAGPAERRTIGAVEPKLRLAASAIIDHLEGLSAALEAAGEPEDTETTPAST